MTNATITAMLDGSDFVNTIMPWGKPGPIQLPADDVERITLINAHLNGDGAHILNSPIDQPAEWRDVERLELAAFCPAADGLARWIAFDLDGYDHGNGGLADPSHAARCFASVADEAGLYDGLLVAQSRGGIGRHIFLILSDPVSLDDAVIGAGALAAAAYRAAESDARDGATHAFRTAGGEIARPGTPGAVEIIPQSSQRLPRGWPLALPTPDQIVDPFTDLPMTLSAVPRCDLENWRQWIFESRLMLAAKTQTEPRRRRAIKSETPKPIDPRTQAYIEGRVEPGARNQSAFAASCNLLGCGVDAGEAEELILTGAAACGLPEREAQQTFLSARRRVSR